MTQSKTEFDVWDWLLFGAMLVISAGIGIYYASIGGRQKTTTEFLMGGRSMQLIPVAISILLSFTSGILILGNPAEMYTQGTQFYLYMFGFVLAAILGSQIFVPLLYPLQLTSSFEVLGGCDRSAEDAYSSMAPDPAFAFVEGPCCPTLDFYIELRFNSKAAKLTGTIIMIVHQVIYMGIASYAPSTALEAVTGFPAWATIITVGIVSTFYTFLGGMKAVVWTDVFQGIVMVAGLLAIVIQGTISVGGIDTVWRINEEWQRIKFFDFNPDPTQRHSFWSLIVGGALLWTMAFGVSQASVQRYCAVPSLAQAKTAVLINVIGIIFLMTIVCFAGIAVFAYYVQKGCDPYTNKDISNSNQIIPFFVMDTLGYPGFPGLFVACLFSGALSSVSSCLNAVSAITWKDILEPFLGGKTETQKTWITRILVVLYGGAGIGMSFMAMNLGGTVVQASLSFTGAASGPILGLFVLGAFFPWANWIGAVVGSICGLTLPLWISIGAYSVVGNPNSLPFPTENCTKPDNSSLFVIMTTTTTPIPPLEGLDVMYTISYLWYSPIGTVTVIIVGMFVSLLTGLTPKNGVDSKYLIPVFDRIFCCLPEQFRRCLRCYIEFEDPEDIKAEQNVEFSVDVEKPVIVPPKPDKFQEKKYHSEPVLEMSFKSLSTTVNGHNVSGIKSDEAPPSYSHVEEFEMQTAKLELL